MASRGMHGMLTAALLMALVAGCTQDPGYAPAELNGPAQEGAEADPNDDQAPEPVALHVETTGTYPINTGFSPARLEVASGAHVSLTFTNRDSVATHAFMIEGVPAASTGNVSPGGQKTLHFDAPEPGDYAYYCNIGDHRQRGQEGTLTVTA